MATVRFAELLSHLDRHGVEFVVVGSVAAILHGAGYTTEDLDIVPSYSPENISRLARALAEIDARYQDPAGRMFRPDERRLSQNRLNLLLTRLGRVDVLRTIGPGRDFEALIAAAERFEVEGVPIRAVDLETLVRAKELANRDKDRAHLMVLRELLRVRRPEDASR